MTPEDFAAMLADPPVTLSLDELKKLVGDYEPAGRNIVRATPSVEEIAANPARFLLILSEDHVLGKDAVLYDRSAKRFFLIRAGNSRSFGNVLDANPPGEYVSEEAERWAREQV